MRGTGNWIDVTRAWPTLALLGAFLLMTPAAWALPPVRVDLDQDGIDDALEQLLAERWAPVMIMEPGEENYPVNVDWHLRHATLRYHEDCGIGCFGDVDETVPIAPNPLDAQASLVGPPWGHPESWGPDHDRRHCDEDNHQHGPIWTTAADPDGEGRTGYSDQATFYLADLADDLRVGSLDPADWVTYVHAYPTADGGLMIQYWHTFGYNDFPFDDHGGDWDASIQVQLDDSLQLAGIWFSRHLDDHPGTFVPCPKGQCDALSFYQGGTHPLVTIDGGGHASFPSAQDWCVDPHTTAYDVTGHLSDIAWWGDVDDPASMRSTDCFLCTFGLPCPGTDEGSTVWKTWSGGDVRQGGADIAHHLATYPDPAPHGGLLNVGEYNPCTSATCDGARQATTLLAGQFLPLNDQQFIEYSGRWGSTSCLPKDGPRGPVFQGFHDGVYTSWYNQGSSVPADAATSPWRDAPVTAIQVGSPVFVRADGATYLASRTPITLSGTQSSLAEQYGPIRTSYRFFPVAGIAGGYQTYGGPFAVSGADATYALNYFSLDGLNNDEALQAQVVTLDNTPPDVTIGAPKTGTYLHSDTLTLGYAVGDGAGSGVASITPAMDNAASVGGHGLASGQAIDLLTEMGVGSHSFVVASADNLGNSGARSVTFEIIVTDASIQLEITRFIANGKIRNAGLAQSLRAKLVVAAAARARGNCAAATGAYQAFINELSGQFIKGVDPATAQILTADAQYLIAHCP